MCRVFLSSALYCWIVRNKRLSETKKPNIRVDNLIYDMCFYECSYGLRFFCSDTELKHFFTFLNCLTVQSTGQSFVLEKDKLNPKLPPMPVRVLYSWVIALYECEDVWRIERLVLCGYIKIRFTICHDDVRSEFWPVPSLLQKLAARLPKTREAREVSHNCLCPPGKFLTFHRIHHTHPHVSLTLWLTDLTSHNSTSVVCATGCIDGP